MLPSLPARVRSGAFALVLVAASLAAVPPARATGAAPRPGPDAASLGRELDAYVAPLLARGDLSGQLLVARRGQVLLERQWGFADRETHAPVTPETRFCIASVTKPMTGTLAIQMMAWRRFGVRDSIARWLPDFPRGDRITVGMLLAHRAGIPHVLVPDSEATRHFSTAELATIAAHESLDFAPGSRSQYSSGGYSVLARVLELASGREYAQLLADSIFTPLGMKHTSDHVSSGSAGQRARGMVPGPHGLQRAPDEDFSHIEGAGSVWSTARDLHRFVQGIVNGRLGPGPQRSYLRDGRLSFNGLVAGFSAYCEYDSASGLEIVFAGNLSTGAPDLLKGAIPRLAAGEHVEPPALPATTNSPPDSATCVAWRGTFRLENGTRLVIRDRDGVLWCNDWVLLPMADGGYFSPRDYGVIHGEKGPDGRISRLDWLQRGTSYPAPRIE